LEVSFLGISSGNGNARDASSTGRDAGFVNMNALKCMNAKNKKKLQPTKRRLGPSARRDPLTDVFILI